MMCAPIIDILSRHKHCERLLLLHTNDKLEKFRINLMPKIDEYDMNKLLELTDEILKKLKKQTLDTKSVPIKSVNFT
jgi:hypothetical protein